MVGRFDARKWMELYRRDLPTPMEVPNLITLKDFGSYRWYALTVLPILTAVGGRVRWMGTLAREFHGPRQADKLLLVRYPSQRRFLAMVANPYYLAINRFRERGVSYFEGAFCHSPEHAAGLWRHEHLLVIHLRDEAGGQGLGWIRRAFRDSDGRFVYSLSEQATCNFFTRSKPTDPNPLTFKQMAFFSFPTAAAAERFVTPALTERLRGAAGEFALHLYRRDDPRSYLPFAGQNAKAA